MILSEICEELNNWFEQRMVFGTFTISGGNLQVDFLQEGQYYRIVGSVFNDGVYQYESDASSLRNETFVGAVWAMAVPTDVVSLAGEISSWIDTYGAAVNSPYASESFGGYSYSKASGSGADGANSGPTWQSVFHSRLNRWRKV